MSIFASMIGHVGLYLFLSCRANNVFTRLGTLQEALNVKPNTSFVGCSEEVASALAPDVMKTVKPLIPDLLAHLPVLLYQGV